MTKKEIQKLVDKWQKILRAGNWTIFWRKANAENELLLKNINGGEPEGIVDIMDSLFLAEIIINEKVPDDKIEEVIYHEIAHIKVQECFFSVRDFCPDSFFQQVLNTAEEQMVRYIESAISSLTGKNAEFLFKRERRPNEKV
jgi:hypothetical protein